METPESNSPLNTAIREFELAEANLVKLERLWKKIEDTIPAGIAFIDSADFENDCRSYAHILEHLPTIDGEKPTTLPMELDEIAQCRLDANEIGDFESKVYVEQKIAAPARELRDYRFHLERARRQLIRETLEDTVSDINTDLHALQVSSDYTNEPDRPVEATEWTSLKDHINKLAMLLGKDLPERSRWGYLKRHLRFGESHDLRDIIDHDWPSVRSAISALMYGEDDPLPVTVADLADLVRSRPSGPVATKLAWDKLTPTDFERLIYDLTSSAAGYENPAWLMDTNAPDKGRDISAFRVFTDPLAGTIRHRVIIQCKHWLTKSVAVTDISTLRDQMTLWEPPRVDVHVIATTGRFTADAVSFVDAHNHSNTSLRIEMWPESHIEQLLAVRPALIATYHLR